MVDQGSQDPGDGPTALPTQGARAIAFIAILVGGFCGLLIGQALARLQCNGSCDLIVGVTGFVAAVVCALGVSVVAVLVLRATGEWKAGSRAGRP